MQAFFGEEHGFLMGKVDGGKNGDEAAAATDCHPSHQVNYVSVSVADHNHRLNEAALSFLLESVTVPCLFGYDSDSL